MSLFFESEGIKLEYEIFGSGEKAMFAFHGFGFGSEMFNILEPSLGKKYTIYSFSLPFHKTSILDKETMLFGIDPVQLKKYFKNFLWHVHFSYFSLTGYSIGGKVALKLIELLPEEVQDVFLFAPDGIKISPWYRFVTGSIIGNWIYSRMMLHPTRYMHIVDFLKSLRMVHQRTANFVKTSLDTSEKRERVYKTWMSLRKLEPDIRRIQKIINDKNLKFNIYFGRHDKVIPASIGQKFVRGLRNKKALHLLDAGHQIVKENLNEKINESL